MENIKIGVALSGGGLCGVAHIGFLKALEENGIKIDMISGISMGSIIGGLYASGMTIQEMENSIGKINKSDLFELNIFKLLKESIFTSKKIEKTLKQYLKVENIEDTKIKFYPQAVDILTGKLYTFENGSIVEALRASSCIPGLFPPVKKDNTYYVDGGIVENIPFNILKEKGADVIIAVNCLNGYQTEGLPKNTLGMLMDSFYIMQEELWKLQKEKYKDNYDIYCFNGLDGTKPISADLKKVSNLIENGYIEGKKYIKEIKKIIKNKQKNLKNT
ncbi:MAG: hypothetical protein E7359_03735 [Clostridiales bacterium]|nr:hypothetical protein [Clostridiales bacterium]